jgi:TatD DNase family protein
VIIDSHCHLHDPTFEDVRGALARATEHDVWGAVAVGCDWETNARTLELATSHGKCVRPAMGFHPDWLKLTDDDLELVEAQVAANHSRLIALGEIGLPWYCLGEAADATEVLTRGRGRLARLLDLARRFDLPVILHAPHGAAVAALEALRRHSIDRAVFHWHKAPVEVTRNIVSTHCGRHRRWCTAPRRRAGGSCDHRVSPRRERRAVALSGGVRRSAVGSMGRLAGGRRGSEDQGPARG